jgi:hypothetical protein
VYFLRSRGLLNGLASANWVFRDESMQMAFAFDVIGTARRQEPGCAEVESGRFLLAVVGLVEDSQRDRFRAAVIIMARDYRLGAGPGAASRR